MAKKTKKAEEVTPEVNSTENTHETENTVEPTEETPESEESYEETTTEETVELKPDEVEPVVEEPIIIHEEPIVVDKSAKQMFEEAIAKIPFVIYQNNIMICHSNPHLVIKTEAKYFEINFKKYSYAGIEVKHK